MRFEALEPIRQGVRVRFGGIGKDIAVGLAHPLRQRVAVCQLRLLR
nr:hypothetical protein [Thioalkalivibrio sp. HK1]